MTNKEAVEFIWDVLDGVKSFNEKGGKGLEALDLAIKSLKTERPQGEWKIGGKTTHYYYCSICGKDGDLQDNFCRNCGADMRKGGAE